MAKISGHSLTHSLTHSSLFLFFFGANRSRCVSAKEYPRPFKLHLRKCTKDGRRFILLIAPDSSVRAARDIGSWSSGLCPRALRQWR